MATTSGWLSKTISSLTGFRLRDDRGCRISGCSEVRVLPRPLPFVDTVLVESIGLSSGWLFSAGDSIVGWTDSTVGWSGVDLGPRVALRFGGWSIDFGSSSTWNESENYQ